MMQNLVDGRQHFWRQLLAERRFVFVEWQLVVADHPFGANEPQLKHDWDQMAELQLAERFGKDCRIGFVVQNNLQSLDRFQKRIVRVDGLNIEQSDGVRGDLQNFEKRRHVSDQRKFRFQVNANRFGRKGIELMDFGSEFLPASGRKVIQPEFEPGNSLGVDQRFSTEEPG